MSLKQASFLAFIGTTLLAIQLVFDLVLDVLSLARGLIAAVTLLTSLIRTFAAVSVAVFFYVYHRAQSWDAVSKVVLGILTGILIFIAAGILATYWVGKMRREMEQKRPQVAMTVTSAAKNPSGP